MPLSEDEQRILQAMERSYYATDPDSARRISRTTLVGYLGGNLRWSAAGFLLGFAVLVASFVTSWVVAVCGFAVMVASGVAFSHNLRRMGRHGWQQLRASAAARGVHESMGEARDRLRRRFGDDR